MNNRARLVIDTNVIVSARVFGGRPATLWRAGLSGAFTAVSSPPLLAEVARILGQKFGWSNAQLKELIIQAAWMGDVVEPGMLLKVCADEPDNRVLECALEGHVDLIVTGDAGLLEMGSFEGIDIVNVAEALARLGIEEGDR